MDIRLDGRRALVTGAGSGIGQAIAVASACVVLCRYACYLHGKTRNLWWLGTDGHLLRCGLESLHRRNSWSDPAATGLRIPGDDIFDRKPDAESLAEKIKAAVEKPGGDKIVEPCRDNSELEPLAAQITLDDFWHHVPPVDEKFQIPNSKSQINPNIQDPGYGFLIIVILILGAYLGFVICNLEL